MIQPVSTLNSFGGTFGIPSSPLLINTTTPVESGGLNSIVPYLSGIRSLNSGDAIGGLATLGLDGATGGLYSAVTGTLQALTGVDIKTELSNVLNTGDLTNWGASTNVASETQKFNEVVLPKVQSKIKGLNSSNYNQILTWVSLYLNYTKMGARHLREHHSRASSTKRANDEIQNQCDILLRATVLKTVNLLESKGITVGKTNKTTTIEALEREANFRYFAHDPNLFDTVHKYTVNYISYNVSFPREQQAPVSALQPTSVVGVTNDTRPLGTTGVIGPHEKDDSHDHDSKKSNSSNLILGVLLSKFLGVW